MATKHPCAHLPPHPDVELPPSVDAFLERAMGGPVDLLLKGNLSDPTLFTVSVDLRDLAAIAGPKWRELFARVTNAKDARVQAGHANR